MVRDPDRLAVYMQTRNMVKIADVVFNIGRLKEAILISCDSETFVLISFEMKEKNGHAKV